MNVTRPSTGRTLRVSGLAASCSSAPQRRASPRVSSSASGSASSAATAGRCSASTGAISRVCAAASPDGPSSCRRIRRGHLAQRDRASEHLQRVAVHVRVVKAVLLDLPRARRARAARPRVAPSSSISSSPRRRGSPRRSGAAPRTRARASTGEPPGVLAAPRAWSAARAQIELDGDPRQPKHAQRIVREGARRGHAQTTGREVLAVRRAGRSARLPRAARRSR